MPAVGSSSPSGAPWAASVSSLFGDPGAIRVRQRFETAGAHVGAGIQMDAFALRASPEIIVLVGNADVREVRIRPEHDLDPDIAEAHVGLARFAERQRSTFLEHEQRAKVAGARESDIEQLGDNDVRRHANCKSAPCRR